MKKQIAYIEIDTHAEIAENFAELTKNSEKFSVDFYFSKKILGRLNSSEIENIIETEPENLIEKLKGKSYDLVIIGTAHRYFHIFKRITKDFPAAIICHNLNFIEAPRKVLLKNILEKDFTFRLKLLLKEGLLSKSEVYKNAKFLWVLDENLEKTLDIEQSKRETHFLPVFFGEKPKTTEKSAEKSEEKLIVIPGEVSQKRRDYFRIMEQLKGFKKDIPYKIVFLGKAGEEELTKIQESEKQLPQNIKIEYFRERIPKNIFENYLAKADFLWCPLKMKTSFFGVEEIYGMTKMSGNIGDAVRFMKPAVFPAGYQSRCPFIIKENENIEQIFSDSTNISENSFENFTKEKIVLQLEKIILNSLKFNEK